VFYHYFILYIIWWKVIYFQSLITRNSIIFNQEKLDLVLLKNKNSWILSWNHSVYFVIDKHFIKISILYSSKRNLFTIVALCQLILITQFKISFWKFLFISFNIEAKIEIQEKFRSNFHKINFLKIRVFQQSSYGRNIAF